MISGNMRASYLGQVATRVLVPWIFFAPNTQVMSRSMHVLRDAVSSLKIVIPNWFVDTSSNGNTYSEVGTGGTMAVKAAIESAGGSITQILFSGSASANIASGNNLVSDAVSFSGNAGDLFYIRIYATNSAGILFSAQGNASLGDRMEAAPSGVTDKTLSGTVANNNPNFSFPPVAIIAQTQRASVFICGTSRSVGSNETIDSTGEIGLIARSIGPGFGYIQGGIPGDYLAKLVQFNARRAALANAYCSDIILEHMINDDISNAGLLQSCKDNYQTVIALFPNKRVWGVTINPRTSYPGNSRTTDYSALNTYIRSKPNLFGVHDVASILDSGSGTWRSIDDTSDGLHEARSGCVKVRDNGVVAI